jgi:hypothetical protein
MNNHFLENNLNLNLIVNQCTMDLLHSNQISLLPVEEWMYVFHQEKLFLKDLFLNKFDPNYIDPTLENLRNYFLGCCLYTDNFYISTKNFPKTHELLLSKFDFFRNILKSMERISILCEELRNFYPDDFNTCTLELLNEKVKVPHRVSLIERAFIFYHSFRDFVKQTYKVLETYCDQIPKMTESTTQNEKRSLECEFNSESETPPKKKRCYRSTKNKKPMVDSNEGEKKIKGKN